MAASSEQSQGGPGAPARRRGTESSRVSTYRTETFARLATPLAEVFGAKTAKVLAAVGLHDLDDLMYYVPRDYLSGTQRTDLSTLTVGERAAVVAEVGARGAEAIRGDQNRWRLEASLTDGTGFLGLTFFGRKHIVDYWLRQLGMGDHGIFVGRIGEFRGALQMTHPTFIMLDAQGQVVGQASDERQQIARVVSKSSMIGIYPARAALPTWQIAECVGIGLDLLKGIADPLPEAVRSGEQLAGLWQAYCLVHRPDNAEDIERGRRRLKFDEALALQLAMVLRRSEASKHHAAAITVVPDGLLHGFDAGLPFSLTDGQRRVGEEIAADMARGTPMQRLLQGEVGSGKTVVALRAMLAAVDAGHQAVLVAPTEVLAEQHAATFRTLMGPLAQAGTLGAPAQATALTLLTGSVNGKARSHALSEISSGRAGIVVGTHALFGADVRFADLALLVIDEQHRFGVEQRAVLADRADRQPHELVLTATPIPRSVAMTIFGDLDVSTLAERPRGAGQVQTTAVLTAVHPGWLSRVWQRLREEALAGHQCFVICPRIGPKDEIGERADISAANAEEVYERLRGHELSGIEVGLMHGRLSATAKREVMRGFAQGSPRVLVATSVVEVGVDIADASAMVVLDADRFGVSALHQLRGRIGRGGQPAICLLVSGADPQSPAAERLAALESSSDGFELAELDLAQRREGDVLGAEQSGGHSTLRLLRVIDDEDIVERAKVVAQRLHAEGTLETDDGLRDMVAAVHRRSEASWLERD
ncbi:ATP-dependent DNA helicase RecG [Propionibacterium cyclohexanicum]|nr:ATP-dependent DNA helicase RecG [Propionibacterium cyclohexanicum]